jgi:hypothetical protein
MTSICREAQEALDQIRALRWLQRQTGNVTPQRREPDITQP